VTADPLVLTAEVDRATARMLKTARALDDAGVAGSSLLPGWTRGHVLTHIARNADGCTNLLTWARTGVETPQYVSMERRGQDIEEGAGRPIADHVADLESAAARFAAAAEIMPPDAWAVPVRWTSGRVEPAARVVWARLLEVEVHHVDLAAGYEPAQWPDAFVHRLFHELARWLDGLPDAPAMRLRATDLDHVVSGTDAAPSITGPGWALVAWLTGRSAGDGLTVDPHGDLPVVPAWK
jgi:maleylpyruvate isomerase